MLILISDITIDSSIQPRESLSQEKLSEYGKVLLSGRELDPIDLFFDGSVYWLADGFHRLEVYYKSGKTHIPAEVHEGRRRDAILFGIERNVKHGLGLNLRERKNSARRLLLDPEWSQWSGREIGRICGLDNKTVEKIKLSIQLLQSVSEEIPQIQNFTNTSDTQPNICKVQRRGREYTIDTTKIGRKTSRKKNHDPQNKIIDITETTQTVYDFLPPASDQSQNTFRVCSAESLNQMIIEDKLELSLKVLITGPHNAFPLILKQLIQTPAFAQLVFDQAQILETQAKGNG